METLHPDTIVAQDDRYVYWSGGQVLPIVSGGDGTEDNGDNGDGTDDGDDDETDEATKPPKGETPEEENSRLRAALQKANKDARRHRLAAREATSKKATDGDDLDAKIAAARAEATDLADTAWGKRLVKVEAKAALAQAGAINAQRATGLLDLDDIELTDDGEVLGLEQAIKDLRKEMPALFGVAQRSTDHKTTGAGPASSTKKLSATQRQALKLQGKDQPDD